MTREDRERWDEKWAGRTGSDLTPHPLLVRYAEQLQGGDALELATGVGQNALWLAEQGYRVTAVDVSGVALARGREEAKKRGLAIDFVRADLDSYQLPAGAFDVVCVFRFLDRGLFAAIEAALRKGGWLFYETYNVRRLEVRPDMSRAYLLEPGELETAFASLSLVESGEDESVSYVICRRR